MKRWMIALAGLAALALSAEAQSFRCENGELMGGPAGTYAKCSTNAYGQITNVRPYTPGSSSRQVRTIYPGQQTAAPSGVRVIRPSTTTTTQVYRGGNRSSVTHSPATPRYAAPAPLRAHRQTQTYARSATVTPRYQQPPAYRATAPVRQPYQPTRVVRTAPPQPQMSRRAVTSTSRYGHQGSGVCRHKIKRIPTRGNITAYEVCYEDLMPIYGKRTRTLYRRIKRASEKACGFENRSIVASFYRHRSDCVTDSVYRAVMETGVPELRSYYLAKHGGTPNVYVGPLRRH